MPYWPAYHPVDYWPVDYWPDYVGGAPSPPAGVVKGSFAACSKAFAFTAAPTTFEYQATDTIFQAEVNPIEFVKTARRLLEYEVMT